VVNTREAIEVAHEPAVVGGEEPPATGEVVPHSPDLDGPHGQRTLRDPPPVVAMSSAAVLPGTVAGVTERGDEHRERSDGEFVDELPEDLDAAGYVGPYVFPDNNRRRVPGYLYLLTAVACIVLWAVAGDDSVLVNDGFLVIGVVLALIGGYHLLAGVDLVVDERDALVHASRAVGFPVGHASAQMGWRGLRSRPTWRILLYSAEEPPLRRGFVLVDGVDGTIVEQVIEDNPEDWSDLDGRLTA
jgi:hypothetical protein